MELYSSLPPRLGVQLEVLPVVVGPVEDLNLVLGAEFAGNDRLLRVVCTISLVSLARSRMKS